MSKIYLDYAAATPIDDSVLEVMSEVSSQNYFNPSALYESAHAIRQRIEDARSDLAKSIGIKPAEIIFCAGATEANNIAIQGVVRKYRGEVITSAIEHKAVLTMADHVISVNTMGRINLEELENKIDDKTVLVSVMLVNNEIGIVQELNEIQKLLELERRRRQKNGNTMPLFLHSDASQAANLLDLHISRLNVDMMTINSAKVYGPKQMAALFVNSSIELESIYYGGGQERGLRSGSENPAAILGFVKAFITAQKHHREEYDRINKISDQAIKLIGEHLPEAQIVNNKHCLPSFISLLLANVDGERMVMALDFAGFQCGTGAACSALENDSSHVLKALGFNEAEARSSLRVSIGKWTTADEIRQFVEALAQVYQKEASIS